MTLLRSLVDVDVTSTFESPLSKLITEFAAILFNDDTDFYFNVRSGGGNLEYIMTRAQRVMNIWSSILCATGGDLRPNKCR